MTAAAIVQTEERLRGEVTAAVLELVELAAAADGFSALNEAASLRLRHGHPETVHLIVRRIGEPVGYGQLDTLRQAQGASDRQAQGASVRQAQGTHRPRAAGALVVHPEHRRQGIGTALLSEMVTASDHRLEIWATHHTQAAQALAARVGLVPIRQLLIMTRSLAEPIPTPDVPAGVVIRAFRPGQDEEAWLAVNARAFADHPEQSSISRTDLEERMNEPWFDPGGFLLAEPTLRQAQGTRTQAQGTVELAGFHWTKQHPDRLGEVYVLGVHPDAGVRGLGRALLAAGLEHLRSAGSTRVQLYVDAENARAVDLYERAGFSVASSDVMYASPNGDVRPLATMHVSSDAS